MRTASSAARKAAVLGITNLRPAAGDAADAFPSFGAAVFPVSRVPNWGDMHSPEEWNRTYGELPDSAFVPVPAYDLRVLTIPMQSLLRPFTEQSVPVITAKLFYSTRFMGTYDVDAGEHTGAHDGVDLKLAYGTPVGAIAGGRVRAVGEDPILGLRVVVEHRHPSDGTFTSVYGHLGSVSVAEGQDVSPGTTLGTVGLTGKTSGPHLHLQVDRGPSGTYVVMAGGDTGTRREAVNPITFLREHAGAAR